MRTVMVFGTFDGIHDGHRAFLRQAREHGDHLIVAVAQDAVVEQLKKRPPQRNIQERIGALADEALADQVVAGDTEIGTYAVVKRYRPDVIALGYDQTALKKDIEQHLSDFGWYVEMVTLRPHKPEIHHTSLLK
ncbi:MAG: adenylyltransferase/cytidyltransferase family protein [Minisyncoccia bacterium]|jgi:FAD synthetase